MTDDLSPVVTLLLENQALLKTLLALQVKTLSEQSGESSESLNRMVDDMIDENLELNWQSFYKSFPRFERLRPE